MRVKLVFDSATTEEVRAAMIAAAHAEVKYPRTKVEGPKHWGMEFDMMHTNEASEILAAVESA